VEVVHLPKKCSVQQIYHQLYQLTLVQVETLAHQVPQVRVVVMEDKRVAQPLVPQVQHYI
jgi:hypothetical protein